jgi:hypothetical protein
MTASTAGAGRTTRELRKFGLTVGGVFLGLTAISWWRGHVWPPTVMGAAGLLLVLPAIAVPSALRPIERGWMAFAELIGRFNARVILTALYWLVVTPVGVLRRRAGDPLDRRLHDGRTTSWIRRPPDTPTLARYRQQF